jgi:hypothetical protein
MTSSRIREWRQIQRDAQREIGNRAYAIHRQPWRVYRNRRLRAEIRAIMAVVDPEYDTPARAEQEGDSDVQPGHHRAP